MKSGRDIAIALMVLVAWAATSFADSPEHNQTQDTGRRWTVQDSIAVRYFVTDLQGAGPTQLGGSGDPVVPSPDGKHFFFIARSGELSSDTTRYEMQVFAADDVQRAFAGSMRPKPLRSVILRSARTTGRGAAIRDARWEDNRWIVFVGLPDSETEARHQIFRLDIQSGELVRYTVGDDAAPVEPSALRAGSIVFQALGKARPWRPLDVYPMVAIRGANLSQVALDERQRDWTLYASYKGGPVHSIGQINQLHRAWVSPDGRWAVAICAPSDSPTPAGWDAYERKPSTGFYNRFMLVDLQAGEARQALDAPIGPATNMGRGAPLEVFWSSDSRHAILFNAALPLASGKPEHTRTAYVVDYDIVSGAWSPLQTIQDSAGNVVKEVGWLKEGEHLLVKAGPVDGSAVSAIQYSWNGKRWKSHRVPTSTALPQPQPAPRVAGLDVKLRESANEAPRIVASNGSSEVSLTDPDPALDGLWRAKVQEVSWVEPDGRRIKGGLMLPRGASSARPLPLVIQAFRYESQFFRPDGPYHTAYAAQALVGQGIAVLALDVPFADPDGVGQSISDTPKEGPAFVARIDAAVAELARQGIVDVERVGLVGFSRAGYLTYYAITHPGQVRLAAATIADAFTASYGEYVETVALGGGSNSPRFFDIMYGGGTFWQNKTGWLDAPAFNVDRVRTPALFAGDLAYRLTAMETVAAFRINKKPFEYLLFYPGGAHQYVRPRAREALMQANVDWMTFWIQGKLPGNEERARNWQEQKKTWEASLAAERKQP